MSTIILSCTVRFPEYMFSRLSDIAHQQDVSLNVLVLRYCQHALDKMDRDKKKAQQT